LHYLHSKICSLYGQRLIDNNAVTLPKPAGRAHIMGVEVVQAAGDVQGDALALVVPGQLALRIVLDGLRQVAALHQLQHLRRAEGRVKVSFWDKAWGRVREARG